MKKRNHLRRWIFDTGRAWFRSLLLLTHQLKLPSHRGISRHIYDIPLLHRRDTVNAIGIETIVPLQFPAALYFFRK